MLTDYLWGLVRKKIKLLKWFLLVCAGLFILSLFFQSDKVLRPKLDANAVVLINGVPSVDSAAIIQELNVLREKKWSQYGGKGSSDVSTIKITKNGTAEDVLFCINFLGVLEERNGGSNHRGGYHIIALPLGPKLNAIVEYEKAKHFK